MAGSLNASRLQPRSTERKSGRPLLLVIPIMRIGSLAFEPQCLYSNATNDNSLASTFLKIYVLNKEKSMTWKTYILNTNPDAPDHEVHVLYDCGHLPIHSNREDLGMHETCQSAVREARRRYPNWDINGCFYCSPTCHTG